MQLMRALIAFLFLAGVSRVTSATAAGTAKVCVGERRSKRDELGEGQGEEKS